MDQFFTDLGLLWKVTRLVNSAEQETMQSEKLIEFNVRVLTDYINGLSMIMPQSQQLAKSVSELLITFCGPIFSWKLPKELNLLCLEFAGIAKVGMRSLRFTINRPSHTENVFMWNSKRCHMLARSQLRRSTRRRRVVEPVGGVS